MPHAIQPFTTVARVVVGAALALFCVPAVVPAQDPVPCVTVGHGGAQVAVDRDAMADPDCLEIVKNKVDVTWTGGEDVANLIIEFDLVDSKKPIDDPNCSGKTCELSKLKTHKKGEFKYRVTVTRSDGSSVTVDPKLIIKN